MNYICISNLQIFTKFRILFLCEFSTESNDMVFTSFTTSKIFNLKLKNSHMKQFFMFYFLMCLDITQFRHSYIYEHFSFMKLYAFVMNSKCKINNNIIYHCEIKCASSITTPMQCFRKLPEDSILRNVFFDSKLSGDI